MRAAASTRDAAGIARRSAVTSLPRLAPNPPSSQKSRCQSTITSAHSPTRHANGYGFAPATSPAAWLDLSPAVIVVRTRAEASGTRGRALSAAHTASHVAVAPNTPCCMWTILIAAAWLPASVAPHPSSSRRHSYPRSLASRMVVWTHTSVVMPPRMIRLIPRERRMRSRSVAQKDPFPGLSTTSSVFSG